MKIFVDIDDTICFYKDGLDKFSRKRNYINAIPNLANIKKINTLYDNGNEIVYWTARGTVTGIDWLEITTNQLNEWGCQYHKISVGEKPAYDLLICDKTKRIEEI
tara:strand:+ start:2654 stop:2968 length:315 start_codon:yes stop_codon:yes gene_type:complete